MKPVLGGRLRVPGGALLAGLFLALLSIGLSLAAEERVLPYANANGYTSTRVLVNPTPDPIDVPRPCQLGPCFVDRIDPFSVLRTPNWPRWGVNVEVVDLDAGLVPYVEIRTPLGTITRISPLDPLDVATFFDLPDDPEFESHIFIASPEADRYVTLWDDGLGAERVVVIADGAALVPVLGPRVQVTRGYDRISPHLPGPSVLYSFAIVVHDATGAITVANSIP